MKKLYVLRHAKSDYPQGVSDHERPINRRGIKDCTAIGEYLKQNNLKPDVILSSDAMRTTMTIKNVLREAGYDIDVDFRKRLYLATPGEMLKEIATINDASQSAMIVCHNPGAEQLVKFLTKSGGYDAISRIKVKYPTAGLARLVLDSDSWKNIQPTSGYLEDFVSPKVLG